ncbi:cytosol aminopeptidase-like [Cimex lectularius]|uniref:Cytosol aminopeptidase n=1 Tax=Cimex lectularius TaxID=79782 RepID=A0A8I6THS3_CIMLE|nr:cytosol aminopeptidase-like [Cimex lectularius]
MAIQFLRPRNFVRLFQQRRSLNCLGDSTELTGVVLGTYREKEDMLGQQRTYTPTTRRFDDALEGRLTELIQISGGLPHMGEVRIFYGLNNKFAATAVTGLGPECNGYNEMEEVDEGKESIRMAAGFGVQALQAQRMRTLFVDSMTHAESAAEGAAMGIWLYQELKNSGEQKLIPRVELFDDCDYTGWQIGLQKAAAQNLARQLAETPGNLLTPIAFALAAVEVLCRAGVSVEVKVRNWSKIMKMEAFLMSARGSCEPPIFLETSYYGCEPDVAPVVLVGKGITFDSGGLCLKTCPDMKHMRGEMSGAAVVVAVCRAAAALQLPINIRGLIPLYENLPGNCALKPGDIIRSMNGKTIVVEHTDFDGRLALADALSYSGNYNPRFILDVGSLSNEVVQLLGTGATAVFSNNDQLFENMRIAGIHTGDRIWRLPLWDHYTEKVTAIPFGDVFDKYRMTGNTPATAAFLNQFTPRVDWIHLDTYGVTRTSGESWSYLREGMSGRPTRTLIEFLAQLACEVSEHSLGNQEPVKGTACVGIE